MSSLVTLSRGYVMDGVDHMLVDDLRAALAPDRVRAEPLELSLYGTRRVGAHGPRRVVCFPLSTEEVQACVRVAAAHGRPFVARGSGTGLAGGAVPLDGAGRHRHDEDEPGARRSTPTHRVAWVEPGVLNLDLRRRVAHLGLHFAPDPSSQQACSIGGNVATNSGGPHCLAYGVTQRPRPRRRGGAARRHGRRSLGGLDPEPAGYDLRGAFVGSEGTLGIATRIAVRLTPDPPAVRTLLLDFASVDDGAATVSAIIAAGHRARRPRDDGRPHHRGGRGLRARRLPARRRRGAARRGRRPRPACVDEPCDRVDGDRRGARRPVRAGRGRRGRAGPALEGPQVAPSAPSPASTPNYYLHDTVVPRTQLVEVLRQRRTRSPTAHDLIVMNVFHAGDGNLHPLLVFDRREPGVMERVHAAGDEIVRRRVAAGGVLSGEHGIGLEKRDLMPLLFAPDDLDAQARLREAFDPDGVANPEKVLPRGRVAATCRASLQEPGCEAGTAVIRSRSRPR